MDYPFISLGPALRVLALLLIFVLIGGAAFVALVLAALPGRIASARHHPQSAAVNVCGWIGLPTGILWVVALVWAYWRPGGGRLGDLQGHLDKLETAVARLEQQRKEGSK
jgi:hypothetical protein